MSTFERPSDFIRIAQSLHAAQRAAQTPLAKQRAADNLAHFFLMASHGRLEQWRLAQVEDIDDSLAANPEDAA